MLHFEICIFSDNSDFPHVSRVTGAYPKKWIQKKNQAHWDTDRQTSKKVAADLISAIAQVASQDELSCCTAEIQAQIFRNLQMHLETERLTQIDIN